MKQYEVTGMSCAACSARVEKAVSKVPGVTSCSVSLLTNSMGVEGTATDQEIVNAVVAAGYGAAPKGAKKEQTAAEEEEALKDHETPKLRKRLIASVIFLVVLMYFSMGPVMLETINLPEVETVNGSIIMEANMETPPTGSFVPQRNDVLQAFGGMDKLTTVKGQIKIKNFTALKQLPDWSKITTLGSITLDYLEDVSGTLMLPNARFETFGETAPQIEIINKVQLSKIETAEDLSNVNFVITSLTNNKFPEIMFKNIKDFTCKPTTNNPDYTISTIQHVHGNLYVTGQMRSKAKFPDLEIVDGYGYIQMPMMGTVSMPVLKEVGGQFYLSGNLTSCELPLLSKICCSASPVYYKEGKGSLAMTLQSKSLNLPELLHVGGEGLFVNQATGITCAKLQTIDGTLQIKQAKSLSQETFSMEKLKTLHGVVFDGLTKFTDYTFFGKFIENGMITEESWSVTKCGYNPTFQKMRDKQYTQQD